MDFKVGGEGGGGGDGAGNTENTKYWNTEKYCRPPWLADKKRFRILDALERLKQ